MFVQGGADVRPAVAAGTQQAVRGQNVPVHDMCGVHYFLRDCAIHEALSCPLLTLSGRGLVRCTCPLMTQSGHSTCEGSIALVFLTKIKRHEDTVWIRNIFIERRALMEPVAFIKVTGR